jgi:hypothetical protein
MPVSAAVSGPVSMRPDGEASGCAARTSRAASISCSLNGSGPALCMPGWAGPGAPGDSG